MKNLKIIHSLIKPYMNKLKKLIKRTIYNNVYLHSIYNLVQRICLSCLVTKIQNNIRQVILLGEVNIIFTHITLKGSYALVKVAEDLETGKKVVLKMYDKYKLLDK